MGLSAVKAEVEALGGIVTVYSEENVGTRFMFSLPLEKVR
jgi:chemotaxis protein histidine kinase CheA